MNIPDIDFLKDISFSITGVIAFPVADLRGAQGMHAPWGSKFFQFHAVFGKFWHNHMLAPPPPREFALPPRRNPGSATAFGLKIPLSVVIFVLRFTTESH